MECGILGICWASLIMPGLVVMPTEPDSPICAVWQVPAQFARRPCERLSKTRGHWGEPDFSKCVDRELFILLDQVSSPFSLVSW